ncbi:hypothetical protein C7S15_8803 [Burkholderia cepacia]|nr:hypothetical protein [Burkholderia cepacia]
MCRTSHAGDRRSNRPNVGGLAHVPSTIAPSRPLFGRYRPAVVLP